MDKNGRDTVSATQRSLSIFALILFRRVIGDRNRGSKVCTSMARDRGFWWRPSRAQVYIRSFLPCAPEKIPHGYRCQVFSTYSCCWEMTSFRLLITRRFFAEQPTVALSVVNR
jgi:hypothetical protein